MIVTLTLTDDQLDAIAERVAAKVSRNSGQPLTVPQAAKRLRLSDDTIRARVKAGQIARVPVEVTGDRVLIPAAEIERLLNPQPEANAR